MKLDLFFALMWDVHIERMEEDRFVMEFPRAEGLYCTQIILKMLSDRTREDNEMLLCASSAPCGGMKTGQNCGASSGAATAMALETAEQYGYMVQVPEGRPGV